MLFRSEQIITCLKEVHNIESAPADKESYRIAYLDKTYDRLKKVRNLVPFANDEFVVVNGKKCRNIFYHQEEVEKAVMAYMPLLPFQLLLDDKKCFCISFHSPQQIHHWQTERDYELF